MSLDQGMDEIFEIFFDESAEGLDVMEAGLLGLAVGEHNGDVVDDIFRAAHSIKGGAATFGFQAISNFTHGVETLLDEVRAGTRPVTTPLVELQLACVDCIRTMLDDLKRDGEVSAGRATSLQTDVETMLATPADAPDATPATLRDRPVRDWQIEFQPHPTFFAANNDVRRIFDVLRGFGRLDVTANVDGLPDLQELDPSRCYLRWSMTFTSDCERDDIIEAFAWAEGDCDLTVEQSCELPVVEGAQIAPPLRNASAEPAEKVKPAEPGKPARDAGSIRVGIDKVDGLLNLVGELVIAQSMLKRCGEEYSPDNVNELRDGLMELERYTRELQENAMQIRMLPISVSFRRFPRLVRDQSARLQKQVELKFSGEQTELDKTVLEKMSDPLVHLVRNSLDHGIETPAERVAAGKPATGILHLSATQEGGNIVIRVEDDGAGLNQDRIRAKAIERGIINESDALSDEQINNLIFQPGFSTADEVSDLSGRGVGMDVVRRNILDLGGRMEVQTQAGKGSIFTVRLPLTLAILDGQLVRVASDTYIFSLLSVLETVLVERSEIKSVVGDGCVYKLRENYIPVVRLREAFGYKAAAVEAEKQLLVIVEGDGCQFGIFVDELLEQQQVVIKSLEKNYRKVDGLAGATILGDGRVALIIDVPGLFQSLLESRAISFSATSGQAAA